MRHACAALLVAVGACSALGQTQYTYNLRLIADGEAGSPGGPTAGMTMPLAFGATRVGFWLQARVAQTGGENWGITRVSPSPGSTSWIAITDPSSATTIRRGEVNSAGTNFGRGLGFRNGGVSSGATGNPAGTTPFPGTIGNENGTIDNGGAGFIPTRIYGFDSYVGATRADTDGDGDGDFDDNGDGVPENPWGVNGATHSASLGGTPWPSDGTFAPWANVYRFYIDLSWATNRVVVLNVSAFVNGSIQAAPTSAGGNTYAMQVAPGQTLTTAYTILIPTPGAAGALAMGALCLGRRRR